ncbi:MAG: asparagine synthase (glutamine-hydrolyzing) [Desulfarculus sp.]|nr:asparagine synthase (glutamine-hydrolyzing) [Desulfarculus sp.]
MCGIAGVLDLAQREAVSQPLLRRMASALAHRGPDDEGYFLDGNLGLAHRRLAIIDPSPAGHQPMCSEDGQVVVSFNGTIYNYPELRALLQARGHVFASQCDTEVLVHGWEEWGADLVPRLNGHFAFAMWEAGSRRLYLVRDRFGTKPLYYANLGGLWLFASEIKAILAHGALAPQLNHEALREYFTFQNLFQPHTLFENVRQVPPACIMSLDARRGISGVHCYWDYDFHHPDETMTLADATAETQRLMIQAVRRQLLSDVPVGAYLSGGMDSGSIVAIASRDLPRMPTFTCGWHLDGVGGAEAGFDERLSAEMMADTFHTEHYEQVIGAGDLKWALPQVVNHLEDLRLGMSYANFYIARLASKFVKVCLGGTGGDELFGGYPWRYYRASRALNRQEFLDDYFAYWQRIVPEEMQTRFFTAQARARMGQANLQEVLTTVFRQHSGLRFETPEDHIANSLYFECKTFLSGLLVIGDKLSMAHGLEERLPFLDNDLVDFAMRVPVRHKLSNIEQWKRQDENLTRKMDSYFAAHNDGKNVLRLGMEKFVPAEIRNRRKQGFSSPDESWYRGANLQLVRGILLHPRAMCHDLIARSEIERTLEEHCRQGVNHRLRIWSLLCFEVWLRTFFGQGAAGLELPQTCLAPVPARAA